MAQPHSISSPQKAIVRPLQPYTAHETGTQIDLVAVIVAMVDDEPVVRVVSTANTDMRLPTARYGWGAPAALEDVVREDVARDTGIDLGYVEQLQCVALPAAAAIKGDGNRSTDSHDMATRLSIGYLALAHCAAEPDAPTSGDWLRWYDVLPWEDWRKGRPAILADALEPRLRAWAGDVLPPDAAGLTRFERARMLFGLDGAGWDEERVAERYDLLAQSGLLNRGLGRHLGPGLSLEHVRTLATAISRLRSKLKSRPVVFDLMPERFTLFELQRTVEAILGPHLHKQNFRRLVEHMGLVEPTDGVKTHTGGRPAKLYRFRHSVLLERLQPGVRVRTTRL